jgi:hypothetical protein
MLAAIPKVGYVVALAFGIPVGLFLLEEILRMSGRRRRRS